MSKSGPTGVEKRDWCMVDDYAHGEDDIIYTEVNIPGPGADLENFNVQYEMGCNCAMGNCIDDSCACVSKYGRNYTPDGYLVEGRMSGPILECNSLCMCCNPVKELGERLEHPQQEIPSECVPNLAHCCNRLVQFGPVGGLEVFSSGRGKGYGLRSSKSIAKGTFICEYAGEVIGLDEARRRSERNARNMNYIFVLKEHIGDTKIIKTCVDPGNIGNIGRYINHSCQPNSVIVPVRVDNPVPRLAIFSCCDIGVGDEITFDYGVGETSSSAGVISANRKLCHCESPNCRLYLPSMKNCCDP